MSASDFSVLRFRSSTVDPRQSCEVTIDGKVSTFLRMRVKAIPLDFIQVSIDQNIRLDIDTPAIVNGELRQFSFSGLTFMDADIKVDGVPQKEVYGMEFEIGPGPIIVTLNYEPTEETAVVMAESERQATDQAKLIRLAIAAGLTEDEAWKLYYDYRGIPSVVRTTVNA